MEPPMPRGSFKTAKLMTAATQTKAASSRLFKKSGGIGANRSHGNGQPWLDRADLRRLGRTQAELVGVRLLDSVSLQEGPNVRHQHQQVERVRGRLLELVFHVPVLCRFVLGVNE